jgi:hypothetical protein
MDIRSSLPVSTGASAPAAALPQVSAQVRSVLATIASATTTSDSQKQALVAATATASQIADVNVAEIALETVSTTGIYLRNTGSEGWPRWQVLTALRAYGLNLTEKPAAPVPNDAALAAQVQQQVANVLREARNVSVAQATQAVQSAPAPAAQVVQAAPVQATPAPRAASPSPASNVAASSGVDTLA